MDFDNNLSNGFSNFQYDEDDLVLIIKNIISENVGLKDVNKTTSFSKDLKIDEATKVEILLAIEHAIGFKIDNELLNSIDSIHQALDIYRCLNNSLVKQEQKKTNINPFKNSKKLGSL